MVRSITRIVEVTAIGFLFALVCDEWLHRGAYFHAFDVSLRVLARSVSG